MRIDGNLSVHQV
ncbi:hypothetical protein Tsp_01386, partial [Trichinella spiralis]